MDDNIRTFQVPSHEDQSFTPDPFEHASESIGATVESDGYVELEMESKECTETVGNNASFVVEMRKRRFTVDNSGVAGFEDKPYDQMGRAA